MLNAWYLKKIMFNMMLKWYKIGRERHDKELVKYIKKVADVEKRTDVFSWIGTREKIEFYPLFGGYVIKRLFRIRDVYRGCVILMRDRYRGWVVFHLRIRRGLWIIRKKLKMVESHNGDMNRKAGN